MKTKDVLAMAGVALATSFAVPVLAEDIPVPNGSFEMIYKPGSTTITADPLNGWTNGIGPDTPMQSGQIAAYSDGTTGTLVDIPGWINTPGIETSYDWLQGSGVVTRINAQAPDGDYFFSANGSNWGNPQGGAVDSDAPLTTVTTVGGDLSYTVSMLYNGPVSPVLIELLADGVPLLPSSSVDPPAPHAWDVVSRTYDAASLAGHLGESLTIRVGWGPEATGTQSHLDMVTLSYTPGGDPNFPLIITQSALNPGSLDFEWESQPGMFYLLRTSSDLAADFATWESVNVPGSVENNGVFEIAAISPLNMHRIVRPGDPMRFYRVEEYSLPPVTIFDENFDSTAAGMLPTGWTTGFDATDTLMNTNWELGDPTGGPATGPTAAFSGANCVGTNLLANYGLSSSTWLRTPAIDLSTATGATLTFHQWVDMDDFDNLDQGTVRVHDAGTLAEIGVVETNITGLSPLDWVEFSAELPAAALGQSVVLEFWFESDDEDFADATGWYLDEVIVTTPAP
jgi:hypothetical protein